MSHDLYVVMTRYSGFMASDREPEQKVYGPASESACRDYINDLTAYDGPGSSRSPLWLKRVEVTYRY